MSKVSLVGGFTPIPEGSHVFQIAEVAYKEEYGKIEVKFKTSKGKTHIETYRISRKDGSTNDGAIKAFSFLAKTATQNYYLTEIEPTDIIGKFVRGVVTHNTQPNKTDPSKTVVFVNINDLSPADGFEETTTAEATTGNVLDLDALLR